MSLARAREKCSDARRVVADGRLGVATVVTFGISTDMCVSTTVRVGANLGYRMVLIEDACDCFDLPRQDRTIIPAEAIHAAHVATLGFEFAEVSSTGAMLEWISASLSAASLLRANGS